MVISKEESLTILKGLELEFARKGEEVWSRGLDYGYESATNGYEKAAMALGMAIKALEGVDID